MRRSHPLSAARIGLLAIVLIRLSAFGAEPLTPTAPVPASDAANLLIINQAQTRAQAAEATNNIPALVAALKAVIAFNQKYRPEKVDRDLTRVRLVGFSGQVKKQ